MIKTRGINEIQVSLCHESIYLPKQPSTKNYVNYQKMVSSAM